MSDVLSEKYDINIPLVDLFLWGGPRSTSAAITSATHIDPSQIGGVSCDHYAFRQPGLDWHIWIQKGDYPLPRKLVLTTTTDEARPQHTSVLTWNLAPSFNDAVFTFDPPPGANEIVFAEDLAASADNKEEKMNLVPLIIKLLCGAAGGNVDGKLFKNLDMGTIGNSVVGIIGGGLGGQILNLLGTDAGTARSPAQQKAAQEVPASTVAAKEETGTAVFYSDKLVGRPLTSGEKYDKKRSDCRTPNSSPGHEGQSDQPEEQQKCRRPYQ